MVLSKSATHPFKKLAFDLKSITSYLEDWRQSREIRHEDNSRRNEDDYHNYQNDQSSRERRHSNDRDRRSNSRYRQKSCCDFEKFDIRLRLGGGA